jgi:hypothetical protein
MAGLQKTLERSFSKMAHGSQNSPPTLRAVTDLLSQPLIKLTRMRSAKQVALLEPHLQDLLHAAGWLYPCFMPSSRLAPNQQEAAMSAWSNCMFLANEFLFHYPARDMAALLPLLEPRSRPQVPGGYSCCLALYKDFPLSEIDICVSATAQVMC